MPLYDYQCSLCEHDFEAYNPISGRHFQHCESCGHRARLAVSAPRVVLFQPDWYEHITTKPLYIESPAQLRRECEKHGAYAKQLESSGIWKGSVGQFKEV